MRDWDKLGNDEIYAIWHSYCKTEFGHYYNDPLCQNRISFKQSIRLTPMEIIKLVDNLLVRLEAKESIDAAL